MGCGRRSYTWWMLTIIGGMIHAVVKELSQKGHAIVALRQNDPIKKNDCVFLVFLA